jgi:hypothetical protein
MTINQRRKGRFRLAVVVAEGLLEDLAVRKVANHSGCY